MIISKWQLNDLESVANAEKAIFKTPWTFKMLEEEFLNPIYICYTAKKDNELCGYIGYHFICDEFHISNVAILYNMRRQGIAKLLINKVIQDAIDNSISGITLEVRESNEPAIKLYESYGFKALGLRKKYYENTEDAIIMWKYL